MLAPYPAGLDVSPADVTYVEADYSTLCAKYGDRLIVLRRELPAIVTSMKLVQFGEMGKYMKVISIKMVIQAKVLSDLEIGEFSHELVVICCPPLSSLQTTQTITLFREKTLVFESMVERILLLELLNAFDEREKEQMCDTLRVIFANSCIEYAEQHKPCTSEWRIECASMYTGGTQLTTAQLIKSYSNSSNRVFDSTTFVDEHTIGIIKYILDKIEGSRAHVVLVHKILRTPAYCKMFYIDDFRCCRAYATYSIVRQHLKMLLCEETSFARGKPSKKITGNEEFIIPLSHVFDMGISNAPDSIEHAKRRLIQFVGAYLTELDLRETAVSGSAMAAVLIVTSEEETFSSSGETSGSNFSRAAAADARFEKYLSVHYPRQLTVPIDPVAFSDHMREFRSEFDDRSIPSYTVTKLGQKVILQTSGALYSTSSTLKIVDGSDVDMSVDVDTWEQFDAVADKHIAVIRKYNPNIVVHRVDSKFGHKWKVRGGPHFRTVEIYRAPFEHILTHHMGMVCGAYTAMFSSEPKFIITSRLVLSMANQCTPNFYYFPSETASPERIILKYYARGFSMNSLPECIMHLITGDQTTSFAREWNLLIRRLDGRRRQKGPVSNGHGQFNVFALHNELNRAHDSTAQTHAAHVLMMTDIDERRIE